ncbi:MAG: alpha-amylase family glycosyl hydrolase [Bacilli bacterium]|jgi:glycosidase|nr:alpha-amylase family glycosyl hydrolase [Bacilli bacterium]
MNLKRKSLIPGLAILLIVTGCQHGGTTSSVISSSGQASSQAAVSSLESLAASSSNSSQAASSSGVSSSSNSSNSTVSSSAVSSASSLSSASSDTVDQYLADLKKNSKSNHLYYHYLRSENTADSYAPFDVWAWPYKPVSGEGAKFDWQGRTTSQDKMSASGDATVDKFGGTYIDIDLMGTYDGGYDKSYKSIGGTSVKYTDAAGNLETMVGLQIVKSESRINSSGFWINDGSNLYIKLADYAFANSDGTTSYHVFVAQDDVQNPKPIPIGTTPDPFASDDGTNVTYGQSKYTDADWTDKALMATSNKFLNGDATASYLQNGAGVGYQIMVASFADSDGDGFGDIYGIDQKLDYIKSLGVNVIWLTPIQLSDSYHGYDITDYTQVDPKFGSTVSPAALKASGKVDSSTAMEDYKLLLKDAHTKGLAVIMDLVLNHTSTTNPWFISSAKLDKNYRGFYQWGNHETDADNINQEKYWYPYGDHVYSYYAKFGSSMPELNYSYASTRAAVSAMAKNWCQIGVDGFRMDAVKHIFLQDEVATATDDTIISDVSGTMNYSSNLSKNLNFWREINYEVKKDYPDCFFVGENFDGHAYHVAPYYEGFDSLFDFYSYYNITAAASYGRNSSLGQPIQSYDGQSSGSAYSADGVNSNSALTYSGNWNLASVMSADNRYRTGGMLPSDSDGYSFINGAFTSNHDIARCINQVAGTMVDGSLVQGNLTSDNYEDYLKSATCAEIAELMLPGCTWIYYGDELGMTGNFKDGTNKSSSYSDLAYRQPMKWTADGKVGDGSFTTGYNITGSGTGIGLDSINASALVPGADTAATSAHFKAIQDFASMKASTPALIKGNYVAYDWGGNSNIFNVHRKLGTSEYMVIINFSSSAISAGNGFASYSLKASYNGATLADFPAYSAALIQVS